MEVDELKDFANNNSAGIGKDSEKTTKNWIEYSPPDYDFMDDLRDNEQELRDNKLKRPPPQPFPQELGLRLDAYNIGRLLPIYLDDFYKDRYLVLRKLGCGMYSTVWLVVNVYSERYYAFKVLSGELYGSGQDAFETEILEKLRDCQNEHAGGRYTIQLVDRLRIRGENGYHVGYVLEIMAETLDQFGKFLRDNMNGDLVRIPIRLLKRLVKQLLMGLDHVHGLGIIHTEIKRDNLMIRLPDQSVVKDLLGLPVFGPAGPPFDPADTVFERTDLPDGSIPYSEMNFLSWPNCEYEFYRRKYNHDPIFDQVRPWNVPCQTLGKVYLPDAPCMQDLLSLEAVICDFGMAGFSHKRTLESPYPDQLKPPEVLIGAPWDSKVDIWALGIALIELLIEWPMFVVHWRGLGIREPYDIVQHVYEIITFFGPFPRSVLDKGDRWTVKCLFDGAGYTWGEPNPYTEFNLADIIWNIVSDCFVAERFGPGEFGYFKRFIQNMMKIDPEERMSAKQLLKEPWLKDVLL